MQTEFPYSRIEFQSEKFQGEKLRELRKKRGLSQKELAERAGRMGISSLSSLENNIYHPSQEVAETLARALEVEVNYFLSSFIDNDVEILLQEIKVNIKRHYYDEALKTLDELENLKKQFSAGQLRRYFLYLAQIYGHKSPPDYATAHQYLKGMLAELKSGSVTNQDWAVYYYELANLHYMEEDYQKALSNYQDGLNYLEDDKDEYLTYQYYTQIGRTYERLQQSNEAEEYFWRAFEHSDGFPPDPNLAALLLNRSKTLLEDGKKEEAYKRMEESAKIYEKLDLLWDGLAVLSYLNVVKAERGELSRDDMLLVNKLLDKPIQPDLPTPSNSNAQQTIMVNQLAINSIVYGKANLPSPEQKRDLEAKAKRLLEQLRGQLQSWRPAQLAQGYVEVARAFKVAGECEEALKTCLDGIQTLKKGDTQLWSNFEPLYEEAEKILLQQRPDEIGQLIGLIKERHKFKEDLEKAARANLKN